MDISWGLYIIEEKHRNIKQNKLKSTHKYIIVKPEERQIQK